VVLALGLLTMLAGCDQAGQKQAEQNQPNQEQADQKQASQKQASQKQVPPQTGETSVSQFPLQIDDQSGLTEAWPLLGGLPFTEGELTDSEKIRVLDADGNEVPAQIDVAARWRDGSIRWAHVAMTADPQGEYQVQFGPDVQRGKVSQALDLQENADGKLKVDTGVVAFEFLPAQLLPDGGQLEGVEFMRNSGDGAYLVDNRGRMARVAGPAAEIQTKILKQGPLLSVVRREGWYVTAEGERVARAKAWFYFAAGSPAVRITHSLIFTEDTNTLWVRDYGLEFRSPTAPERAVFAVGGGSQEELLALQPVEVEKLIEVPLKGGEAYMLQDTFPHFREREALAVVGRTSSITKRGEIVRFGKEDLVGEWPAAGDWGDGEWANYGLTVVMPWLAQRFPKEIAFGPDGARAVLWSGRSGRELDFRAATLVKEYWQSWADESGEGGAEALAAGPSNAAGTARTHDVWLIPHSGKAESAALTARANAASHPPLLLADPAWLAGTGALGWPTHPVDKERFPREEEVLSEFWDDLMRRYELLRRTGFIEFGGRPHIRGGQHFRVGGLGDYGLRRHVWGLYARSGDRKYLDYATRFSRFSGDLAFAHLDVGSKRAGTFIIDEDTRYERPFYWDNTTELLGKTTGHDIVHWTLDHYLTGDEYPMELARMHVNAFKTQWDDNWPLRKSYDTLFMNLRVLGNLYAIDHDEELLGFGRSLLEFATDLELPNAINDELPHGSFYKEDRNSISLYYYYRDTGDELAKQALLQNIEDKYRFNRLGGSFEGQSYSAFLFSVAYELTGNPDYLPVLASLLDEHRRWPGVGALTMHMNPTMGVPAALGVLAGIEEPVRPYPLLRQYGDPQPAQILVRKSEGLPVHMRVHVLMASEVPEDTPTTALLAPYGAAAQPEVLPLGVTAMQETMKANRLNLRRRYVELTVPADKPAGLYAIDFPDTEYADILNSDAVEISAVSPSGYRMHGPADYFRVADGMETLELFLGVPTRVIRPDGSVALEAGKDAIGDQEIPVNGQFGPWRLEPSQSGIIRLFNAEPVFARSPQLLVTGAGATPSPRFKAPDKEMGFVAGPSGQALHLPGTKRLGFSRGKPTEQGYEFFPGDEGTVEFWFRPNWASVDLPFTIGSSFNDSYFLRSGSQDLQYRRGKSKLGGKNNTAPEFASLNLWAQGEESSAGFSGRYWFEAGEWVHVAFTWRITDGQPGHLGDYGVFVNGEPLPRDTFKGSKTHWPGGMTSNEPFVLREAEETIAIGPFDGSIAQLRISDVVRYEEAFAPPASLPDPDSHTRVQFPLDGNLDGVSASGSTVVLKP